METKHGYLNYIVSRPFNAILLIRKKQKIYFKEERNTLKKVLDIAFPFISLLLSALIIYCLYGQFETGRIFSDLFALSIFLNFLYVSFRYFFAKFYRIREEDPDYDRIVDRNIFNIAASVFLIILFIFLLISSKSAYYIRYFINDDSRTEAKINVFYKDKTYPTDSFTLNQNTVNSIEINPDNISEIRLIIGVFNCPEPISLKFNGMICDLTDAYILFENRIWEKEYIENRIYLGLDTFIRDNNFEILCGKLHVNYPIKIEFQLNEK